MRTYLSGALAALATSLGLALMPPAASAQNFQVGHFNNGNDTPLRFACEGLPSHAELTSVLSGVVGPGNTGLANDMWATIVNADGIVCAVTFSGVNRQSQWGASRVISAQKATTANSLSLSAGEGGVFNGLALSTGNLWAATQPGGSLFGLQFSNPVDPAVAYRGPARLFGRRADPMVGRRVGGVNVFGGGLALYNENGERIGAVGLSGDTSCSDHIQAWKVRDGLGLDFVPSGVSATGDDNIVFDLDADGLSAGGFGHPTCLDAAAEIDAANALPIDFPLGN